MYEEFVNKFCLVKNQNTDLSVKSCKAKPGIIQFHQKKLTNCYSNGQLNKLK